MICQTLATQTTYNDASTYDRFRGWDCKLKNDHKNWAPRIQDRGVGVGETRGASASGLFHS
ncbi:MAG: hypothetical protein ACRD1B_04545 [Thermoanaerobaculia bacterium]